MTAYDIAHSAFRVAHPLTASPDQPLEVIDRQAIALLALEDGGAGLLLVDAIDVALDLRGAVLDVVLERRARGDALFFIERHLAAGRVDALRLALADLLARGAARLGATGPRGPGGDHHHEQEATHCAR